MKKKIELSPSTNILFKNFLSQLSINKKMYINIYVSILQLHILYYSVFNKNKENNIAIQIRKNLKTF